MYVQWDPKDRVDAWSGDRIWAKLHSRFDTAGGWQITEDKIYQKNIVATFSGVEARRDLRQTRTMIQRQLATHPRR